MEIRRWGEMETIKEAGRGGDEAALKKDVKKIEAVLEKDVGIRKWQEVEKRLHWRKMWRW